MAMKRIKSSRFPGVYYRESSVRKHNGRPDRCYDYCLREHGKLRWVCVGWLSQGFSEQMAANRRLEAQTLLSRGESAMPERTARLTLEDVAAAYLDWLEAEGKHVAQERMRYETHVKNSLGHLPLSALGERAGTFKQEMLRRMAPGSVLRLLSTLRAMVNFAVRRGMWDGVNPFGRDRLKMPQPQNKGERFLAPEEACALLDALELRSPQLRNMAWLSLKTGLRSTEIFGLTGADADAKAGVLWVTEKGGRRVAIRVSADVLHMLGSYGRKPFELIFQSRCGGRLEKVSRTFERTCVDIGLMPANAEERERLDPRKKVWFHTLRHTFASWLAQSGKVTLYELRDLLRHKSITMTERYAHLIPAQVQAKAAIIDEMLK